MSGQVTMPSFPATKEAWNSNFAAQERAQVNQFARSPAPREELPISADEDGMQPFQLNGTQAKQAGRPE